MTEYNPIGPKQDSFKAFQMNNFLQSFLGAYNQEEIEGYSLALAKLFRWCELVLQVRKENVLKRTRYNMKKKKEREEAIASENERQEEKKAFIQEQLNTWMDEQN